MASRILCWLFQGYRFCAYTPASGSSLSVSVSCVPSAVSIGKFVTLNMSLSMFVLRVVSDQCFFLFVSFVFALQQLFTTIAVQISIAQTIIQTC